MSYNNNPHNDAHASYNNIFNIPMYPINSTSLRHTSTSTSTSTNSCPNPHYNKYYNHEHNTYAIPLHALKRQLDNK